jgi:hypothetical protein
VRSERMRLSALIARGALPIESRCRATVRSVSLGHHAPGAQNRLVLMAAGLRLVNVWHRDGTIGQKSSPRWRISSGDASEMVWDLHDRCAADLNRSVCGAGANGFAIIRSTIL